MSSVTLPIAPERFAAALKELTLTTIQIKLLELRNQIEHLDYSNEQLLPFARGEATALGTPRGEPDRDCADAIRENEVIIDRIQERIRLVRAEVESRGLSWTEFQGKEEIEAEVAEKAKSRAAAGTNGSNGHAVDHEGQAAGAESSGEGQGRDWHWHPAVRDGTLAMMEAPMDFIPGARPTPRATPEEREMERRMEAAMVRAVEAMNWDREGLDL